MYKRLGSSYEVSSEGEVRNIKTGNVPKGKYKNGYRYVNPSYGKIKKTCQVHGLAASLFIPNPANYPKEVMYGNFKKIITKKNMKHGVCMENCSNDSGTGLCSHYCWSC